MNIIFVLFQQMRNCFLSFLFLDRTIDFNPSRSSSTLICLFLSLQLYQTFLPMPDGHRTVSLSLEATERAMHSTNSMSLMVSMWMMIKLSTSLTVRITVLWNGSMVQRVIEWWPVEMAKEIELIS